MAVLLNGLGSIVRKMQPKTTYITTICKAYKSPLIHFLRIGFIVNMAGTISTINDMTILKISYDVK